MAKIPAQVKSIIDKYIQELEKSDIPVKAAVVFGSYAKGNADEWSDIDIALVSDAFEGDRFSDRNRIRKITLAVSSDLSPLPFRPEHFTSEDPFVQEILETGVIVV